LSANELAQIIKSGRSWARKKTQKRSRFGLKKALQVLRENFLLNVLQAKLEVAAASLIWINDGTCSPATVRCGS
jgi:hypothetical protein